MDFEYYYLGRIPDVRTVAVKLNQQAQVIVLDTINFQNYLHRRRYRHYGGLQSYPEQRYKIPYSGEWHLIIDIAASAKLIDSSVRFIGS